MHNLPPQSEFDRAWAEQNRAKTSSLRNVGIIFLIMSFMFMAFGICSIWVLGLGLIPMLLAIPLFVLGIVFMVVG